MRKIIEIPALSGIRFHIFKTNGVPNVKQITHYTQSSWKLFQEWLEATFEWEDEDRIVFKSINSVNNDSNSNYIFHTRGVTVFKFEDQIIHILYDNRSESLRKNEILNRVKKLIRSATGIKIGVVHLVNGNLQIRYRDLNTYQTDISEILCINNDINKSELISSIQTDTGNGLYIFQGDEGTGKRSFIKSLLSEINDISLFIPQSVTFRIDSLEMINLLIDYPGSVIIIEHAESVLIKRKPDHDSVIYSLLKMAEGFLSDYLDLKIICLIQSDIQFIDPNLHNDSILKEYVGFNELNVIAAQEIASLLGLQKTVSKPIRLQNLIQADSNEVI